MRKLSPDTAFVLSLVSVALAARLFFIVLYGGVNYYGGISGSYLNLLNNIVEGRGFVIRVDISPKDAPDPQWSYEPFLERPIGYPILLLPFYAVMRSVVVLQMFQAILASLGSILLWRIGRQLASERVARRGALIYALWPLSARFDIVLLPDAVVGPILLASLWFLIHGLRKENQTFWFLLSGLACGAAMTMRADVVLLPIAIAGGLLLAVNWKLAVKGSFMVMLGAGLVVGAHTWRNYEVTKGEILPLAIGSGISLWEGISQFGDTLGTVYDDVRTAELEGWRTWAYPDGLSRDRKRMNEAVRIIFNHPEFYARLMIRRIPSILKPDGIITGRFMPNPSSYFAHRSDRTWITYVQDFPIPFGCQVLVVLAQYGVVLLALIGFQPKQKSLLWIPMAVIVYYIFIHIITNAESRYFYPAIPLTLLLASIGIERIHAYRKDPVS